MSGKCYKAYLTIMVCGFGLDWIPSGYDRSTGYFDGSSERSEIHKGVEHRQHHVLEWSIDPFVWLVMLHFHYSQQSANWYGGTFFSVLFFLHVHGLDFKRQCSASLWRVSLFRSVRYFIIANTEIFVSHERMKRQYSISHAQTESIFTKKLP